jgi:hypothetical protein
LQSRVGGREDAVSITAVRKKSDRPDEICIHCKMGSLRFIVSLPSDEFTIAELKKEIARKLMCEFGTRRAKSLVGRSIPLTEILKESQSISRNPRFWDLF